MLNLDYGSGSDNDSDTEMAPAPKVSKPAPTLKSSLSSSLPSTTKRASFALPPPTNGTATSSTSGLLLPPTKAKKVKKIAIGLPELPKDVDDDDDGRPAAKKPRLESGAGTSSLLSMLPAPKSKNPVLAPAPRVLGGGGGPGLVFNAPSKPAQAMAMGYAAGDTDEQADDAPVASLPPPKASAATFMPPSLAKGRVNVNVEDTGLATKAPLKATPGAVSAVPTTDFFSLGTASSSRASPSLPKLPLSAPSLPPSSLLPTHSSAPKLVDFTPPEPTPSDSYPGYYQLPSGAWAAHDAAYYKSFYDKWKKEYDTHVRSLERGARGFEDYDADAAGEVDAAAEMERAKVEVKELEERKALTNGAQGEAAAPRMNVQGAKLGGRARSRHQLTTLLTEAYQNREALEERIAQGKRNRKEAGGKYGF